MYHYADAIEALAEAFPDEHVLTHEGGHRTWREFEARAARLGQAFADAGLAPGSKVGLLLYNCPEYYETFLAALKMRMVPFNINYRYVGSELRYLLDNADCEALVYHRSLSGVVAEVLQDSPQVKLAVEVDDGGEGRERRPLVRGIAGRIGAGAAHRAAAGRLPPDVHGRNDRDAEGRHLRGHAVVDGPDGDLREERPRHRPAADGARATCRRREGAAGERSRSGRHAVVAADAHRGPRQQPAVPDAGRALRDAAQPPFRSDGAVAGHRPRARHVHRHRRRRVRAADARRARRSQGARRDARPVVPQDRDLLGRDLVAGRQGEDAGMARCDADRRRRRHRGADGAADQPPRADRGVGALRSACRDAPVRRGRSRNSQRLHRAGPDRGRRRARCRRATTRIPRRRRRRSASSTASALRSSATGASGTPTGRCSCSGAARRASTPAARRSIRRRSST